MKEGKLRKSEWVVLDIPHSFVETIVAKYHYSGGGANTSAYRHGLFRKGEYECLGVASWIPPTKSAAVATYPKNWKGVLCLSRLAIAPEVPKNGASFLLGASMKKIDRGLWPCLVTYADEMQGHTGAIYRATNWEYCGMTPKEPAFFKDERMIARKAGPKTRTRQEMEEMGCTMVGRFAKHKFIHIVEGVDPPKTPEQKAFDL
jgi:hypothetical protein